MPPPHQRQHAPPPSQWQQAPAPQWQQASPGPEQRHAGNEPPPGRHTWRAPNSSFDQAAAPLIRPTRLSVGDVVLGGLALFFTGPIVAAGFGGYPTATAAVAVIISVLMPVAVVFRRSHPAISAIVVYAAALVHFTAGIPVLPADVLIFVSLFSVTVYGSTWARRAGLLGALAGCLLQGLALLFLDGSPSLDSMIAGGLTFGFLVAVVLAVWALALVRRARVERLRALAERAYRLEIERDQQAQIATAAERARIAREMHDVVAHSLSVVISQADGGRYAAAADPAAAERALTTIADTGRSALADLRRILGVLRDGDGAVALTPQPTQDDLRTLLTPLRQAGLEVSLEEFGTPQQVPAPTGLGIYRIVQESLTNVLKHAGPAATARVVVHWHPDHLELTITDTGTPGRTDAQPAPPPGGHGLVGLRERATMLGGDLVAGPRPDGGWLVRATIPLAPPPHPQEQ